MRKRTKWAVSKYLLAFGLLVWVVGTNWNPADGYGLKFAYEAHVTGRIPIRYGYFALAIIVCLGAVTLTFVRWHVLIRLQGLPLRLGDTVRLGAMGLFFNTFLPGSLGGDVVKAVILARSQETRRVTAMTTILADRAIGLWSLSAIAALIGTTFWTTGWIRGGPESLIQWITIAGGAVTGIGVLGWLGFGLWPTRAERLGDWLGRQPWVGDMGAELWRAILQYRRRPWGLLTAVLLAAVSHSAFVLAFFLCAGTLMTSETSNSQIPSLADHYLIVPVGLLVRSVPLFPGGLGIGEWGFAELYKSFGSPGASGILGSLVYRAIYYILGLAGYFVCAQSAATDRQQSASNCSRTRTIT